MSWKKGIAAITAVVFTFLMAAPAAMAQRREPPEGWTAHGVQNVRNLVTSLAASGDATMCRNAMSAGRYSSHCDSWNRRVWSGQIAGLWRQAERTRYYSGGYGSGWGYYGGNYGYMGYGSGGYWFRNWDTQTKIMLGTAIGIGIWKLVSDHRRGNKQKEVVEDHTQALKDNTASNRELAEELRHQLQTGNKAATQVAASSDSVVNATGCDILVRESNGRHVEIPHGQARYVIDAEGFTVKTMPGFCPNGIAVEYLKNRTVGLVSCDS